MAGIVYIIMIAGGDMSQCKKKCSEIEICSSFQATTITVKNLGPPALLSLTVTNASPAVGPKATLESEGVLSSTGDLPLMGPKLPPTVVFVPDSPLAAPSLAAFFSPNERAEMEKQGPCTLRPWLLGRMAAKTAAQLLSLQKSCAFEVRKTKGGQPYIFLLKEKKTFGYLSISHTEGAAVAACALNPVGIDIERAGRQIKPKVVDWVFTEGEKKIAKKA
ncbi:MAG: 4'-phosphopantetheinyl transferase family protein, partial [Candidatus Adiutrix sp.]